MTITLRPAELADSRMVFRWRNLTEIVNLGSEQRPVDWQEHTRWFQNMLSASSQAMYIIGAPLLDGEVPIGQMRFDQLEGGLCQVGIHLHPNHQGKGYGVEALKQGCEEISSTWAMPILAFIRNGNKNSMKAFGRAGFTLSDLEPIPDHVTLEYVGDTP